MDLNYLNNRHMTFQVRALSQKWRTRQRDSVTNKKLSYFCIGVQSTRYNGEDGNEKYTSEI